jgi:hypothetical protein
MTRAALRALGDGPDHRTTIAAATRATTDADRAARFLAEGGADRLAAAVAAADRVDDEPALRVGRAASVALNATARNGFSCGAQNTHV